MTQFIAQHPGLIFGIIAVGVFIFQAVRVLKKAKKIDREGIITDAVISRVEETWDPETTSSSFTAYAQYKDEHGECRESPVALTDTPEYTSGQMIRIRFIPGKYDMVRIAKQDTVN